MTKHRSPKPPWRQHDLRSLVTGATLLASGGGGTYDSVKKLLDGFGSDYYKTDSVDVVSLDEAITGTEYAAVVAYIGAPEAIGAIEYPEAAVHAAEYLRDHLDEQGKRLGYLVPVEIGAVSSLVPCLVAAKLGLKVIDADGAKRAVPELPMLTFAMADISTNPTVLTNADGFSVTIDVAHRLGREHWWQKHHYMAEAVEKLTRPVLGLDAFEEAAGLGIWVMSPSELKKAVRLTDTLSLSRNIGRKILEEGPSASGLVSYLNEQCELETFQIFSGRFQKGGVSLNTGGGFDVGRITLEDTRTREKAVVLYQNESLIAWNDTKRSPIAMGPDSIAYYVADDQKVYSNGDVVVDGDIAPSLLDKDVSLIGIAADPILRGGEIERLTVMENVLRPKDRSIFKSFRSVLQGMGYCGCYVPIEDIWK